MTNPTLTPRLQAVQLARQIIAKNPVYLDTETTGLEKQDEIVEIAIIDDMGEILFQSLIKPSQPIPAATSRIHGITDVMVQKAPAWPVAWMQIRPLLVNRLIVAYNSEFDQRMMQQTHTRFRMPWKDPLNFVDLLRIYAQFHGEWDPIRRSWKYHSLEKAGKLCGIPLPNAHRAAADTLLTRELLHHISKA